MENYRVTIQYKNKISSKKFEQTFDVEVQSVLHIHQAALKKLNGKYGDSSITSLKYERIDLGDTSL